MEIIGILKDHREELKDVNQIRDLRAQLAGVEEKYNTLVRENTEATEQQVVFDPWSSHLRWRPRKGSVVKKEKRRDGCEG